MISLPEYTGQKLPIEIPNSRDELGELFKKMGFKRGAEIGVEEGVFSLILCEGNPDMHLTGVDAWTAYRGYRDHVSQEKLDDLYNKTINRLKDYNFTAVRGFSQDVVQTIPDNCLDFVYIDAAHDFVNVTLDIAAWEKRVRKGGIVAGHDYRRTKGGAVNHTKDVVQAWTYSHGIKPWYVLRGDRAATWLWVKS
jgi:predicted O-methyltransferase YrrM